VLVRSNHISNFKEDVNFFAEKDINILFGVFADFNPALFAFLDIITLLVFLLILLI